VAESGFLSLPVYVYRWLTLTVVLGAYT